MTARRYCPGIVTLGAAIGITALLLQGCLQLRSAVTDSGSPTVTERREPVAAGPAQTEDSSLMAANKKEWTLLLYMIAESEQNEKLALDDIRSFAFNADSAIYNLVVQIDRAATGSHFEARDFDNGSWTDCRRFVIEKNSAFHDGFHIRQLEVLGEVNMGDPATLANFITWGVSSFPARRYLLCIFGGANPNGIGGDRSENPVDPLSTVFGETTQALRRATSPITGIGQRLDLCIFWGCNYGMLENDFVIKEYCDVTARSEIPTYSAEAAASAILTGLNANPAVSASELARLWVDAYIDYAALQNRQGAWAAIDLGPGFLHYHLAVDLFARELIKAGGIDYGPIADAVVSTIRCYPIEFDLGHFARLIAASQTLPDELTSAALDVIRTYGFPPPRTGKPLVHFASVDGVVPPRETWPNGDFHELTGTKIRQAPYTENPRVFPEKARYTPFVTNNAWRWFIAGRTSLPHKPLVTFESNSLGDVVCNSAAPYSFRVKLRNSGGAHAYDVSGTLTSVDPHIMIEDSTSTFADIPSEGTSISNQDFTFSLDPDMPGRHRIWFMLKIVANRDDYINTTTFCIDMSPCTSGRE